MCLLFVLLGESTDIPIRSYCRHCQTNTNTHTQKKFFLGTEIPKTHAASHREISIPQGRGSRSSQTACMCVCVCALFIFPWTNLAPHAELKLVSHAQPSPPIFLIFVFRQDFFPFPGIFFFKFSIEFFLSLINFLKIYNSWNWISRSGRIKTSFCVPLLRFIIIHFMGQFPISGYTIKSNFSWLFPNQQ